MTNEERTSMLNLISEDDVQAALDKLHSIEMDESSKKEAILISSRFKKLEQQKRLGILSFEQSNLTEHQITAHLIDLINHPADKPFPKDKSIDETKATQISIWKYLTTAVVVIGLLVSLAEVSNLIDIFPNDTSTEMHQLSVFVTDTDGNVVLEHEGVLNTSIGNRPMRETIGEHGRTNFGDIPAEYLGDTITIGFKTEGWEIANGKNTFVFSGDPIMLKVKKDDSLGMVKGVVKTRDGQEGIEGAQVLINTDTAIFTDVNGVFKILLPDYMHITKATDRYLLTVSKDGYNTSTDYYTPKSSDADIRLKIK